MGYNQARLRRLNEARIAAPGEYASGLSPYLHFGHVSIEEVVETVLATTGTPEELRLHNRGKRDGFCNDLDVNSFLDDAYVERLPTIAASRPGRPA